MGGACAPIRSPPGVSAPDIRRVYIPKPGKREKRPLGVPCVNDRALQRSTAQVFVGHLRGGFFALLIWRTA